MKRLFALMFAVALFAPLASAQVIFEETFDTEASADNFMIVEALPAEDPALGIRHEYAFAGPDGDTSLWGIDIPAPNTTDGSTSTLWAYVQLLGEGTGDGINFYTNEDFSGNISVTVDVFMRWNGSGSTEYMALGLFCSGDEFNNFEQIFDGADGLGSGGDGYVWWMNTDGDCASCDYMISKFTPGVSIQEGTGEPPTAETPGDPYAFECGSWTTDDELFVNFCLLDSLNIPIFAEIYPAEGRAGLFNGNVEGAPTNDWTTVNMTYVDGTITVSLDGTVVHTYTDEAMTYTEGKVLLAWEDPFSSIGLEQMGFFDNLVVEQLDTPVEGWEVY